MHKTLLAILVLLIAAPLLSACGDPINYEDRPLADRMCVRTSVLGPC